MKKATTKIITLAIALIIVLGISAIPAFAASNLAANPTASTVYVNGAAKAFEAYIINGNNYFKLRDLAYVMNGTAKQFEVGYDNATKAITLTTGKAYTPDGGEMVSGDSKAKTASPTASRIYLNGKELNLTVYLIGGNNFFKLRDLMEAIDVFVGYDNATKAIALETSKGYEPEGSATPTPPATTTPEPTPTPTPTPTPSQPPAIPSSENIDSRLLANSWRYTYTSMQSMFQAFYFFYEDGTFVNDHLGLWPRKFVGNYYVSEGIIYFTNIKQYNKNVGTAIFGYAGIETYTFYDDLPDLSSQFEFGTDSNGYFLRIGKVYNQTQLGHVEFSNCSLFRVSTIVTGAGE